MSEGLDHLNELPPENAEALLQPCCGSREWARGVAASRPFRDIGELLAVSDHVWWSLGREDWLEAFAAHPRIGEKVEEKVAKPGGERARAWSEQEQSRVRGVPPEILERLSRGNRLYQQKFGHIFIICATGKDAAEMLTILRQRLGNDPETELRVAAEEQRKITNLRLEKLFS
jgi:OHCU decarboxylase